MRGGGVAAAAAATVVLGGCGSSSPDAGEPTRTSASRDGYVTVAPTSPRAGSRPTRAEVLGGAGSAAERRTVAQFLQARVAVVNGGDDGRLATVATARQQRLTAKVRDQVAAEGWELPARPRAAVVSRRTAGGQTTLGVCLWLPSVEYVDAATGRPALGRVLRAWKPALLTLTGSPPDLKVDTVRAPGDSRAVDCGGLDP